MPHYRVARVRFNKDFDAELAKRNERIVKVEVVLDPELVGDGMGVPLSVFKTNPTLNDIAAAYLVDTVVDEMDQLIYGVD